MARLARLFVPGCAQHVMARGHNRMAVFTDDVDRQTWLAMLKDVLPRCGVALHAWVLMGNHYHLLLTAKTAADTSSLIQTVGRRYTQWFNTRHGRSGTLWEGRYRSAVVADERYLLVCQRYIDLNPVRAGLAARPEDWWWSSYAHHAGLRTDDFLQDHALYWGLGNTSFERQAAWRALCDEGLSAAQVQTVTASTLSGWALGEVDGVQANRRATAAARGRPFLSPERAAARKTGRAP